MSNTKICEGDGLPDLESLCRLCLEPKSGTVNIFDSGELSIPVRIMACTALEVQPTDGLPKLICDNCRFHLEKSYYFRKNCQLSDAKLRKHIRLINAGKKSRVFLKSSEADDDDDDGKLMLEDSILFIQKEEEKILKEEEERRSKWQAEQLEIFRKEETQKLFEDFGNFMNSRKIFEKPESVTKEKREHVEKEHSPVKSEPSLSRPTKSKPENTYTRRPKAKKNIARKADEGVIEADNVNEITSSEQIGAHEQQEQIFIYDEVGENTDGTIQTYLLYEKNDVEGNEHIIEIDGEHLDEFDDELDRDDDGDTGTEGELNTNLNEDEESEGYAFASKYDEIDGRADEHERPDSDNYVESYQIEENGEIQYVKEEGSEDALSTSAEQIEDCIDMPPAKSKCKRKAADSDPCYVPEKERKLTTAIPIISKVSTEDLKIFKCSECPQSFTREKSLNRHRSAHRKGREYSCEFCDKWFSCKSSLDRHIRIHTGEKPYTCEECGKSYMQKEVLKRHIVIHSGQRPHPCPHCPRSFVQKLMLTQHINATHLEVPKIQKHACHMCSKSFHHASGLSRHLITHSGKKFNCSSCGRSFNDKSSIRRHVLAVHSKYDKTMIELEKMSSKDEPSNSSIEFVSEMN